MNLFFREKERGTQKVQCTCDALVPTKTVNHIQPTHQQIINSFLNYLSELRCKR